MKLHADTFNYTPYSAGFAAGLEWGRRAAIKSILAKLESAKNHPPYLNGEWLSYRDAMAHAQLIIKKENAE